MPAVNLIWPMGDGSVLHDPAHGVANGGIRVHRADPLTASAYDNSLARLPVLSLANLHTRARRLRIAGPVLQSLDGMSPGLAEGDILLNLFPVEYNQAYPDFTVPATMIECADEVALSRFAGWYGYTLGGSIDGGNIALWLGGEIYPWGTIDEAGRTTANECTIYPPRLLMTIASVLSGSQAARAQIGQGTTDDSCPITCTLTGGMSFSLQLGVGSTPPGDNLGHLTGSLTLTVTEWWSHGGKYNTATGALL